MLTQAALAGCSYYLPEQVLTNDELSIAFGDWSPDKILAKTGIARRHISDASETASDLAVRAAECLFAQHRGLRDSVDFILFCTQSPDYFLPTTACLIQDRLAVSRQAGALDFNLGCSGYVYGLGLAKGLVETGQASNVLLLTADTYTKMIHPKDRGTRTLFGDGAAATWIKRMDSDSAAIGPFVFGTNGEGAANLIVRRGAFREHAGGSVLGPLPTPGPEHLFMNGPEIFTFTLAEVPKLVQTLLTRSGKSCGDIDLFVFHQANEFMLQHLRKKLSIPQERFLVSMRECGNTVSSTIPIALCDAIQQNRLKHGDLLMLVGFGVGYSWAATLVQWQ